MDKHIILEGRVKLLSPLSHIGQSTGTESFLNTLQVLDANLEPVEVFVYSGNAFRGAMRDLAAEYMMDKLSITGLGLDLFYMFFSGGSIGGEQSIDIDQARRFRAAVPMFSLFGGGVGNQLIGGKLCVGALYPICDECAGILPVAYRVEGVSWRQFISEQSYTRTDDAKNERLRERFLASEDTPMLPGAKEKAKEDRKPQQMRYTQELIAPGALFYQRIDFKHVTDLELGAWVSALHEFRKHPYIGGQSRIGHGLCELTYTWRDADEGQAQHFLTVGSETFDPGPEATRALDAYDEFLKSVYVQYLESNKVSLAKMLSGDVQ